MDFKSLPAYKKRKIQDIKKKWPTIYGLELDGKLYIIRPLSRKEFGTVIELQEYEDLDAEKYTLLSCVIDPELHSWNINDMLAGTVQTLHYTILEVSGFSSVDSLFNLLETNRANMELADNQVVALLCKAFPQFTPETINDFNIDKIAYHLALAEQILGVTLDIQKNIKNTKLNTPDSGPVDFEADNKNLFKSEVGNFMPKSDHNLDKLNGGNVE